MDYEKVFRQLGNVLVPNSGPADSVQGELVRNIGKICHEYYHNGNLNLGHNSHIRIVSIDFVNDFRMRIDYLWEHLAGHDYLLYLEERDSESAIFDAETHDQILTDIACILMITDSVPWDDSPDRDDPWGADDIWCDAIERNKERLPSIIHEMWPETDEEGPYIRLRNRVVDWCRLHQRLFSHNDQIPFSVEHYTDSLKREIENEETKNAAVAEIFKEDS